MSTLVASKTTHEFSLAEIKKLLAKDLGVESHKVSVEYMKRDTSPESSRSSQMEVVTVRVTIDHTARSPDRNLVGGRD